MWVQFRARKTKGWFIMMQIRKQHIYAFFIELNAKSNGEFTTDEIKYVSKATIPEAKKILKKLVKISGLDVGEITFFNENCSIKYVYNYDGKLFKKETWF